VEKSLQPSTAQPNGTKPPLPAIPAKRYFTIGEVSELCQVKPYVLRYWEQEFTQLKPMKRRGNRRYYQHHEVLLIRRIRDLLYDQGFTISGARNRLASQAVANGDGDASARDIASDGDAGLIDDDTPTPTSARATRANANAAAISAEQLRIELLAIRRLLAN
jgi:DNA-binding transcriptional MerR regulator